jgi:protein-disulfide isomerase
MHQVLMRNQRDLGRAKLTEYAAELGLDMAAFTEALQSRRGRARVMRDVFEARGLRIGATPTYFVNGRRVVGSRSFEDFKAIIEHELEARGSATAPSGR